MKREVSMENNYNKVKYINCPFCGQNFGTSTIDKFQSVCPNCGEELDVNITKYGVKIERHKKVS